MGLRFTLLVCAFACFLPGGAVRAAPPCVPAATPSPLFTKTDLMIPMSDGVQIAATLFAPPSSCTQAPETRHPAIMMFHGLGQTRNSLDLNNWSANKIAETYFAPQGYVVLTFDARAHGQSGGLFSLDGPRELQDTRELFAWLTSRPDVDPGRVGALGVSYGGGMVWLATVSGVPFKAIVPAATWTDLQQALAPQGLLRSGVVVGFSRDIPQDRYAPGLYGELTNALGSGSVEALGDFLSQRSTRARLADLSVPTLLVQGRRDFAFDPGQALAAYRLLKGPKRIYFGDLGHTPAENPPDEVPHFALEARGWFDRFLKGVDNGMGNRPEVEIAHSPWDGKTETFDSLPPTRTLAFAARPRSTLTATGKVVRTFKRVPHIETFGAPVVRLQASSRTGYAHLAVVLSVVRPDGSEPIVVTDGGAATPQVGRATRTVTIALPNEITSIPAGSRLRVTIAATSTAQNVANLVYLNPVATKSRATIGRVKLSLPVLKKPVSP